MLERLRTKIFPTAVEMQAFGADIKKFVDFEPDAQKEDDQYIIQYMSNIIFGDVILQNKNGQTQKESVVIKFQPTTKFATSNFNIDSHFHNEVLFYTEVVPFLQKYDTDNFLTRNVPEFIYGNATNGQNPQEDVVIMKNLAKKGFRLAEERLFLDDKHINLALDRIAKFHALSFKSLHDDPKGFREIASKINSQSLKHSGINGNNSSRFSWNLLKFRGIDPLKDDPEYKDRLEAVNKHCENTLRWMNKYKEFSGPSSVLTRGDLTRNNLLFKYGQDGQPEEVVFIDWAFMRHSTLVLDIGVLLMLNTSPESKKLDWDDYLQTYHRVLTQQLTGYPALPFPDFELEVRKTGVYGYHWSAFLLPAALETETDTKEQLDSLDPESRMQYLMEFGGPKATEYLTELVKHMLDRKFIFEV